MFSYAKRSLNFLGWTSLPAGRLKNVRHFLSANAKASSTAEKRQLPKLKKQQHA
jgi:hypothetical protein